MTILQGLVAHMQVADATFRRVGDVVADWKDAHPFSPQLESPTNH